MSEKKISLSFVNNGEPFILKGITVERQEQLMDEMVKLEKKYKDKPNIYTREVNKILVLKTLQVVDDKISLQDINNMHPEDFMKLFTMIWNNGRELTKGEETDFQNLK